MRGAAFDLELPVVGPSALACGAQLKNTVCVTKGRRAYVSPGTGDLAEYDNYALFCGQIADLLSGADVYPRIVAHDLHPDYISTRYARRLVRDDGESDRRLIAVQHHHAHIAACMAERGLTERVIGVALDGMGLGDDGALWGGEILSADLRAYRREAHFKQYRLLGGDQATLHPDRMAFSCLYDEFSGDDDAIAKVLPSLAPRERDILRRMAETGAHSPMTSSAGRLFDIVSAILGLCTTISREAEAAVKLQAAADSTVEGEYDFQLDGSVLDFGPMIKEIVVDMGRGEDKGKVSARFHNTVAAGVVSACEAVREAKGANSVVLSGGVFMNDFLRRRVVNGLDAGGFRVYFPETLGPGDRGLSLGQAAIAVAGTDQPPEH